MTDLLAFPYIIATAIVGMILIYFVLRAFFRGSGYSFVGFKPRTSTVPARFLSHPMTMGPVIGRDTPSSRPDEPGEPDPTYADALRATTLDAVFEVLESLPEAEVDNDYDEELDLRVMRHALGLAKSSEEAQRLSEYAAAGSQIERESVERCCELASTTGEALDLAYDFGVDTWYGKLCIERAAELNKAKAP